MFRFLQYGLLLFVPLAAMLSSCRASMCRKKDTLILNRSSENYKHSMVMPVICDVPICDVNEDGSIGKSGMCSVCKEVVFDPDIIVEAERAWKSLYLNKSHQERPPGWWYLSQEWRLRALKEPAIYEIPDGVDEVIRYMHPTDAWDGIIIRVEKNDRGVFMAAKVGFSCPDPDQPVWIDHNGIKGKAKVGVRELKEKEWKGLEEILERHKFWSRGRKVRNIHEGCHDRILEGNGVNKKYTHVGLNCPNEEDRTVVNEVGDYLLNLVGIEDNYSSGFMMWCNGRCNIPEETNARPAAEDEN